MYLKFMNYVKVCIALFIFVSLSFNASAEKNVDSELRIIKSDMNELIVSYTPQFIGFDTVLTRLGVKTLKPNFAYPLLNSGNANGPTEFYRQSLFNVLSDKSFEISDIQVGKTEEYNGVIAPIPDENNIYNIDWSSYKMYDRHQFVEAKYAGIADRYNVAALKLYPAVYDGFNDKIIIVKEIRVTIKFNNSNIAGNTNNQPNNIAINADETTAWKMPRHPKNTSDVNKNNKLLGVGNQNWIKITIPNTGNYKIDASQINSLGVNIAASDVPSIRVFGKSGENLPESISADLQNQFSEQPIIVKTNSDGSFNSVIFYANGTTGFELKNKQIMHYINNFSDVNYYYITWGGEAGKRATETDPGTDNVNYEPQTYVHRIAFEEELHNIFGSGSGKQWFGRTLFPVIFTNQLYDLDRTGKILYRYSVAQKAQNAGTVNIYENNQQIALLSIYGIAGQAWTEGYRSRSSVTLPASNIASDGRSVLKFDYSNPSISTSMAYFDYYEIHYPRSFSAINNELYFIPELNWSGNIKYDINNFSGQAIGWDITDLENPKLLKNLSDLNNTFVFEDKKDSNAFKRYYISSTFCKPSKIERIQFADLRHNLPSADAIVIAPEEFKESAQKYCDYRNSQKELKVSYVPLNYIFTEFGSGIRDHTAIRDYIAYIKENAPVEPKYIILWGDGHYDYRNLEVKSTSWIPPYESIDDVDCFNENYSFASDDFYSFIEGEDRIPDIVVARVPVSSADNGDFMLEKIKGYENNSALDAWRTKLLFIAGDSYAGQESDGGAHVMSSESVANYNIPNDMQNKKIYMTEYKTEFVNGNRRKPQVTEDFVSTVNNEGVAFVNWVGHGSPQVWAWEQIFDRDLTIPLLKNSDKLFFVVAATCDFGRYDLGDFQCGAEELVRYSAGGAIGTLAATRLVIGSANYDLNRRFYVALFQRDNAGNYQRIGDVYKVMKSSTASDSDNDLRYNLLCDPLVRLVIPQKTIQIDSINGICLSTCKDTINLKALNTVVIKGKVLDYGSSETDVNFNGSAVISMYDSDVMINAIDDYDGTNVDILKYGPALNKSAYPVKNGEFTGEFVVPKDIGFSNFSGRIFIYANSNNNTFAKGYTRMFRVRGIDANANKDNNGPEISIYLDSRDFKNNDIVCSTPLLLVDLKDDSGINSTGTGIGHRIEGWLDNSSEPMDLTSIFTTSIDDSKSGSISKILYGLSSGEHTIRIRAWDVYNNFSVAETKFRIEKANTIVISSLSAYPNPVTTATNIEFTHNIVDNFTANLEIYNSVGDLIRSFTKNFSSLHSGSFEWDLLDNYKNIVPSGSYICKLKLTSSKATATKFSMLTVVR